MEARDDVALAADPFHVVRRCAFKRSVEERLPEAAHIDHHCEATLHGHRAQARTQFPCGAAVKPREDQFALLESDALDVFTESHSDPLLPSSDFAS